MQKTIKAILFIIKVIRSIITLATIILPALNVIEKKLNKKLEGV